MPPLELTGSPHQLVMPAICIHCGAAARERVWIEQRFEHHNSEGSPTYSMVPVAVPFCPACNATHQRERRAVSPLARLGMMFRSHIMYGVVCQVALGLFFLLKFSLPTTIAAVFFLLLAAVCARAAYNETRHLAVSPPTSVSSAFVFSEDHSSMFEPERRFYTLRNPQFADAFLHVNRDRLWDAASPHAQRAAVKRSWAIAILIVLAMAVIIWGIYNDYAAD
jgi:hypothetical protein